MGEDLDIVGVDTAEVKFRCWNRDDQERLLDELDPMAHDIWQKPMEGTVSFDVGEGKDYGVATLFENGEYRPIAVCDAISFGSDVEHSGYVGVEAGEYTFSAEVVDIRPHEIIYHLCGLNAEWERISEALDRTIRSWEECCRLFERLQYRKRRKTTYKTIRRDCAKRNRHK